MKKLILMIAAVAMAATVYGVKALSVATTVTQSDGTQLTVRQYGDENFHYYATTDGVLLRHIGSDFFIASVESDGSLTSTGQLAHEAGERSTDEQALITAQDKELFFTAAAQQARRVAVRREAIREDATLLAHVDSPKVLVILAEFSDLAFTVNQPYKTFYQYLNGDEQENLGNYNTRNYGSVKTYFEDMSFGAFSPQFDIYGPVTLSQPLSYYGADDDYMSLFVPDVCTAVDDSVDFSLYDANGDGKVDLVYIIYAGYSESIDGNSTDCIWPKSGTISGGTYDGVSVYRYGVNNELNYTEEYATSKGNIYVNGIGLFCHEFSHCLGLPDLYVTVSGDLQLADNQEMEYWSVMDSGTYLYNGYAPPAYTAWEREALGWFTIDTLTEAGTVELLPIDSGGKAYRIMNDNDTTGHEYFIIENIQQTGWNTRQYGHGMLVTHVDYDSDKFDIKTNAVNNEEGHPRMTVVAADGTLTNVYSLSTSSEAKEVYGGDPFPGTSAVTELTDDGDVTPAVYNGDALGKPLYDITEDETAGTVTFCFLEESTEESEDTDDSTGINNITTRETSSATVYSADGREMRSGTLPAGIYIVGGKKIAIK